jgi:predicted membrane-bound spermidine synthase
VSALHLKVLVFVSGLTVMAVEMTALRLLAPFFGTSLLVTTVLIGSMMAFLSLGYWLGGVIGDRRPTLQSLCRVTGAAAVAILLIPFISQPILRACASIIRPLLEGNELTEPVVAFAMLVGGLLGTLLLLALPVTLLGMVSPWAVRLAVEDVGNSGKAAGRLYSLSTFGSILGSFLPALMLIPLLGVRNTFVGVGAALLAVSVPGALKRATPAGAAAAALALPLMAIPQGIIRPMDGLVTELESLYHFIQVVIEPYGSCEAAYHLYLNEGVGVHSVKCLDPEKEIRGCWTYMAAAPLWRDVPEDAKEVLIIGLAGGTVARQMLAAFPDVHIDGVEIDGKVLEVGREYLDDDDPRITPYVMDGRVFLEHREKKYDVIIIDAYRQPYIPFHLTTVEFWTLVKSRLADDGVVTINSASVRGSSRRLAQMIYRTLREVFPTVHLVDATQSNDIIFATVNPRPVEWAADKLDELPEGNALDSIRPRLRKRSVGPVEGWETARLLTDDQAPVEMAWELMAMDYLK